MDWLNFFDRNGIGFATAGANVSRGWVGIRCPFCPDDPSYHLGISLKGGGWSCWRNPSHRGRDGVRLVQALIHCSEEEAKRIVHGNKPLPADRDLSREVRRLLGLLDGEPVDPGTEQLGFPTHFRSLMNGSPLAKPFIAYLRERGFDKNQQRWLASRAGYDLKYATQGPFAYRLIFPLKDRYERLLSWTGRSIRRGEEIRYKSLAREQSVVVVKDGLLGLPLLWKCPDPRLLLVCEGPFDAIKITTYGHHFGVYATCLFGLSMSIGQATLLDELRERFSRMRLLLDRGADFKALAMADSGLGLRAAFTPAGFKDPGEMTPQAVVEFCLSMI